MAQQTTILWGDDKKKVKAPSAWVRYSFLDPAARQERLMCAVKWIVIRAEQAFRGTHRWRTYAHQNSWQAGSLMVASEMWGDSGMWGAIQVWMVGLKEKCRRRLGCESIE